MATLLLRLNTHQLTVLVQLTVSYQRKQRQDSRQELDAENGAEIIQKCCLVVQLTFSEPGTICPAVRHTRWLVPPTSIINLKNATQT